MILFYLYKKFFFMGGGFFLNGPRNGPARVFGAGFLGVGGGARAG